jgi:hypothetical protein
MVHAGFQMRLPCHKKTDLIDRSEDVCNDSPDNLSNISALSSSLPLSGEHESLCYSMDGNEYLMSN